MNRTLLLFAIYAVPAIAPAAVTIGPDTFGYIGVQTNNPAAFTSIKGAGGTRVTPADPAAATYDDRFYSAPIGFNFSFYGASSNAVFLSTNGFMAFGGTTNTNQTLNAQITASYTNGSFASASPIPPDSNLQVDRQIIAPWWDDMQFTNGQNGGLYILTRTAGAIQELVIEWNNVAFFNATTNGVTFQSILRSDGTFDFIYSDVVNGSTGTNGAESTIGIHDLGGTTTNGRFLEWSTDQPLSVANGDVISFIPVPEPGSAAVIGLAVFGMAVRRRRA